VINATSPAVNDTRRTEEWGGLVTGYIRAYYFHNEGQVSGERPEAMRVLEINNTGLLPKTFIINNTVAHQAQYGGMTAPEVVESYFNTLRNQTTEEQHIVIENDRQGINGTLGPNGTITQTD
jgi:hypothetical protein